MSFLVIIASLVAPMIPHTPRSQKPEDRYIRSVSVIDDDLESNYQFIGILVKYFIIASLTCTYTCTCRYLKYM